MKILIWNKKSNVFVRNADAWTADPDQARKFPSSLAAMEFCVRYRLHDVSILLKFGSERFDIALQPRCFPWMQPNRVRDRSHPNAAGQ